MHPTKRRARYHPDVRLLCLSDVHGHADALAAVLATAERRGYDRIIVAGDLCFSRARPARDLAPPRQQAARSPSRASATGPWRPSTSAESPARGATTSGRASDRLVAVRRELGELILARLARLPQEVRLPLGDGGELVVVHGSPADPTEALSHDMSDAELLALIGDDPADVIICGGSHVPFDREVGGVRVINVGSVGEAPAGDGPRQGSPF